jgi:putative selenate reductase
VELVPQHVSVLLARLLHEHESGGPIFGLPREGFWSGHEGLDLSVPFHGRRAANGVGPAAGPHTQLALNLVVSWLAGSRILELKTVQINDRLEIPRPCIDAANIGFNVEWSQELRLEESLDEYVSGWFLIHVLQHLNPMGASADCMDTTFDLSVGYDLAGIQSDAIASWIDSVLDASDRIAKLRDELPPALKAAVADVEVPGQISRTVTLSTFHGCPADEIEGIVEHLYERHGVDVIVKLNPTLLGYERVDELLRERMGYTHIELDREAFEKDLQWEQAMAMFERLGTSAAARGLGLGAKFTNTLVVKNHKTFFPNDPVMYLSGQPLHVLAMTLANRFVQATDGRYGAPSFSAGVDAKNFFEAAACGMVPVTTCTDLLRPGGYTRLPKFLDKLAQEMGKLGAATTPEYILLRAGQSKDAAHDAAAVWKAAQANLAAYAERVANDPRYSAAKNAKEPRKVGSPLALFDCLSCNKCVPVCPQQANFVLAIGAMELDTADLVVAGGAVEQRPARFETAKVEQWACYSDFCNECGNCDVFCPEDGGPYRVKPRFFSTPASFDASAPGDAFLVEEGRVLARLEGVVHELSESGEQAVFSDGVVTATLDGDHAVVETGVAQGAAEGHTLPLWRYHAARLVRDAVLAGSNPVSATRLAALKEG